jgi:hypothetical protein
MQDAIVWGPLIIKYEWIAFAVSALAAYMTMKYWLKGKSDVSKPILEDIGNVFFGAFLIWKFSVIIFNPISVWNNPSYMLYFSGGERGFWLAVIVALIYLTLLSKKRQISFWKYATVLAVGLLTFKMVYSSFQLYFSNPTQSILYDLSQMVLAIGLLIWMYSRKERIGKPDEIKQLILWFSIGQIFSYFFKSMHTAVFIGLTSEQLFFLALALCCLFFPNHRKMEPFKES